MLSCAANPHYTANVLLKALSLVLCWDHSLGNSPPPLLPVHLNLNVLALQYIRVQNVYACAYCNHHVLCWLCGCGCCAERSWQMQPCSLHAAAASCQGMVIARPVVFVFSMAQQTACCFGALRLECQQAWLSMKLTRCVLPPAGCVH